MGKGGENTHFCVFFVQFYKLKLKKLHYESFCPQFSKSICISVTHFKKNLWFRFRIKKTGLDTLLYIRKSRINTEFLSFEFFGAKK